MRSSPPPSAPHFSPLLFLPPTPSPLARLPPPPPLPPLSESEEWNPRGVGSSGKPQRVSTAHGAWPALRDVHLFVYSFRLERRFTEVHTWIILYGQMIVVRGP